MAESGRIEGVRLSPFNGQNKEFLAEEWLDGFMTGQEKALAELKGRRMGGLK